MYVRYGGTSLNYGVLLSDALIKRSCHIRGALREGGGGTWLSSPPPTHPLSGNDSSLVTKPWPLSHLTFCFPLPSTCLPLRLLLIPPHHTLVRHVLSLNTVISRQKTDLSYIGHALRLFTACHFISFTCSHNLSLYILRTTHSNLHCVCIYLSWWPFCFPLCIQATEDCQDAVEAEAEQEIEEFTRQKAAAERVRQQREEEEAERMRRERERESRGVMWGLGELGWGGGVMWGLGELGWVGVWVCMLVCMWVGVGECGWVLTYTCTC